MSITFIEFSLKDLNLTDEILSKIKALLEGQGVQGDVLLGQYTALDALLLDDSLKQAGYVSVDKRDSIFFDGTDLVIRSQLSEEGGGGYDEQALVPLGLDGMGNAWFAFPEPHDQYGTPCLSLVKVKNVKFFM